MIDISILRS